MIWVFVSCFALRQLGESAPGALSGNGPVRWYVGLCGQLLIVARILGFDMIKKIPDRILGRASRKAGIRAWA